MIHSELRMTPHGDVSKFAWSSLLKFRNVNFVSAEIMKIHNLNEKNLHNAKKQASQIKYCLQQAEEYFLAARSVSMSTKPLLLYYGVMSLALAEILIKGSGDSSLDRARGQHAHHGLDLRLTANPSRLDALQDSAATLRATPLIKANGERFGTFELWHRVARETPLSGTVENILGGGAVQVGPRIIFFGSDERLPLPPANGISLLQCFQAHPGMKHVLAQNSVSSSTVRIKAEASVTESKNVVDLSITVQPGRLDLINELYEKITIHPSAVNFLNITEFNSGCMISWSRPTNDSTELDFPNFPIPLAIQEDIENAYALTEIDSLNEFGVLYFGIYIIGNYVRYFPDQWMVDVENLSPLALSARIFSEIVEERAPILSLSEISKIWYLRE